MNRPSPRSTLMLFALASLAGNVFLPNPASAVTFEKRVVASTDDAESFPSGSMYVNSSGLDLINDGSQNQTVGMRWTAVTIPKGALITTAYIQFAAKESQSGVTNLVFHGQAADNAPAFTTTNGNLGAGPRPRTAVSASWAPVAWLASDGAGAKQRTPELKALIQEIVNRSGWASGNALAIIVSGSGQRVAHSWDGNSAEAPLLHVEYSTAPPPNNPPVAGLTVSQLAVPPLTVSADGSTSTDTDANPIASYRFDFGDGTPTVTANAPAASATHAYASPGAYTVTLTAVDTGNLSSTPVTRSITVQPEEPPVASLSLTPVASPPLTVLANGSGSTDSDLTPIASYRFDFGDGTATVTANAPTSSRQHTYASPGTYTVTLIATDTGGNASAPVTQSITVALPDDPPIARLSVTQLPTPPLTVEADGTGSTDADVTPIASYEFDFGDGTPAVITNPPTATAAHVYAAPGTYTVTLIVTDTGGKVSTAVTQSIQVLPDGPPVAQLTLSQPPVPANTVNANASGSTDNDLTPIASYEFDFGDGSPVVTTQAPSATASHTYASADAQTITLVAIDTAGNRSAPVSEHITLQAEEPPIAALVLSQAPSPFLTLIADGSYSSDGDLTPIASYEFDFGDGSPVITTYAPNATVTHTYASPGLYFVTLIAKDNAGYASEMVMEAIFIEAPPENPPLAQLTVTRAPTPQLVIHADGSASTDEDLTPVASYQFDFGDGTPAVSVNAPSATASHTYEQLGTYTVTLIVTDTGGFASAPATRSIQVFPPDDPPVADLTVSQPPTPARTVIANGSGSTDRDFTPIASYRFTFGDGSPDVTVNAPTTTASHTYASAGTYTVTLVATDTGGNASSPVSKSITVQADSPPVARLSVSQVATPVLTVNADGSTSTDSDLTPIASYRFDFGDGTAQVTVNAPTATASHTYASAGAYTVTLIATDTGGSASPPATRSITVVPDNPPVASLSVSQPPTPALTVVANGAGSTDSDLTPIASYRFSFGDGTPTVTVNVPSTTASHTYAAAGTYTVTLIATDTGGQESSPVTRSITVQPENPPVASLTVTQSPSPALTVSANGSASTDADLTPIASYRFTWGDGTAATTTTAPNATASHTYATAGTYTVTLIVTDTANLSSAPVTASVTVVSSGIVDMRIAAGSDDVEQAATGAMSLTSSDIELVQDSSTQTVGLRWTGINVPKNATITNAYIQFDAREAHTEATTLTIRGEASDNAAAFTTSSGNVTGRTRTSAYGTWSPPAWASTDGQGAKQRTPNLAFPVQQIVDRANWASGNAMVFIIDGTGHRTAYAYESGATRAALLHIEYGNGPAPPQQAPVANLTVTSAGLTVTANGSGSTDGDLTPIASYRFTWGDGTATTTTTAPSATASHTYASPGTYTVTLVAIDTANNTSSPASQSIALQAPNPPTARLTVSPNGDLTAAANGSTSTAGSNPIASYRFTWGDGSASTTTTAPVNTASHTYASAGTYTVSLIVTDTANISSASVSASVTVTANVSGVLDKRIAASSDDAEQASSGSVSLTSSDLELVQDSSTQMVGLRWTGINIPKNATITNAYVQFHARESHSEATTLTFRAEASDNAATFTTTSSNISTRGRTGTSVTWLPPAWTSTQGAGADQRTPNLAAIIQSTVNRAGWVSGNALALLIDGTGHRTATSFDGGASQAPLLHVEWGSGSPPSNTPPTARITVSASGLTVTANGSTSTAGSNPIASYRFTWGDGTANTTTTAPTATASHTYASPGTYTVTLVAIDTANNTSSPASQAITLQSSPPTARLTVSPNGNLAAAANGSTSTAGSNPIASYRFTWGDGTAATTTTAPVNTANHTYASAGTYTVSLIVTDTANISSASVSANVTVAANVSGVLDKRVAASSDDAEQASSGSVSLTSADLELVQDSSTQMVGLRWTGINIPKSAVITNAYVQFTARESHSEATTLTFRAEASDNAATFTTSSSNLSTRGRTGTSVTWLPPAWTSTQGAGANQRTPNLAAIIQSTVNRSGWVSGNALALLIDGTGHRTATSFDGGASQAPLLHVEWGNGSPPSNTPPTARITVSASGLTVTANGSTSTAGSNPIASYRFTWGDGTATTTTIAPTSSTTHTYATAGTYTVSLTVTDAANVTSSPANASITVSGGGGGGGSGIAVYAGYYSTHHPDNPRPKPTPWMGSSNTVFVGTPDPGTSNEWDTAALRIDNLGSTALSGVSVVVDIGSNRFALWNSQTIPAGGRVIFAQTDFENFDGSDTNPAGCYDCDPNDCLTKVVSTIPVARVTIGGTTTNYYDNAQTMNTEGVDAAGCPYTGGRNDESRSWVRIYPSGGAGAAAGEAVQGSSDGQVRAPAVQGPALSWLSKPFPNPSRGQLELMFRIGSVTQVKIAVYDVAGRLKREVSDLELDPGDYLQQVNLSGMSAGMYFFTISSPQGTLKHPFILIR